MPQARFYFYFYTQERIVMEKRKVIIDCDPGIDDSLAIMLALKSPEIEVVGITVVCGNSPVEMGFENAKKNFETDESTGCTGVRR